MGIEVIGAGFGRTGTLSMKAALEQLGHGPCHHMLEVAVHSGHALGWASAIRGDHGELDRLLAGYRSAVDFPACVVWEELWRAAPDARVLLTVRPSVDWWRSFSATIGPRIVAGEAGRDDGFGDLSLAINEVVFGGRADDEAVAIASYEAHNARVIETVPDDRLCVYEVGSGWEPLCEFLGVDVPAEPFPRSNTTEEFRAVMAANDVTAADTGE